MSEKFNPQGPSPSDVFRNIDNERLERQKDTTDSYREGWDRIYGRRPEHEFLVEVAEEFKLTHQGGRREKS